MLPSQLHFPDLILLYRRSLDLTQKQFGEKFGVSSVSVYKWEAGRAKAPYEVLRAALNWYQFSTSEEVEEAAKIFPKNHKPTPPYLASLPSEAAPDEEDKD